LAIDDEIDAVMEAVSLHPVETVRARWGLSLRIVWCYNAILQGNDPRGYLWKCMDWNALKYHPAAALNISRALLLTAILEAAAGQKNMAKLAIERLFDASKCGFSRMTMMGGSEASAVEIEGLARTVGMSIRLLPWLGAAYAGHVLPIERVIIEPPSIFATCLKLVIQRLPT
jgi:hypothetical protein